MVDIGNHEDSLKELSKTSLVNNVTVILCWSAAEAARYLELYKSYEHANASAIRGTESKGYGEKMVDFVTVPRSINKTDAVSLVSAFGSIRAAVNARPEEIAVVGGWGEKKVRRWCAVVDEPFRARKAAKKGLVRRETTEDTEEQVNGLLDRALPLSRVPLRDMSTIREQERSQVPPNLATKRDKSREPQERGQSADAAEQFHMWDPDDDDDEEALVAAAAEEEERLAREKRKEMARKDDELSEGVVAALAKLRDKT
jgi:DNA excision repair protein ERCC-1